MERKVFKYKFITAVILTFNFIMLLFCGIGFVELISLISVHTDYFIVIILALSIIFNVLGIVLIFIKSKKSIIALNIFYSSVAILFIPAFIMREFDNTDEYSLTDRIIFFSILLLTIFLFFITNKFRHKGSQYNEIEEIGKLQ